MAQPTAHPLSYKEAMVAKMGQTYYLLRQQRIARVSQEWVTLSLFLFLYHIMDKVYKAIVK